MQPIAVGPQQWRWCRYDSRTRRLLSVPSSAVTDVRTNLGLRTKFASVAPPHRRMKALVVSSSLTQLSWSVTRRHILALNLIASAAIISTAWLFFYGIPALLRLKKACESLEKQLEVAREQLPDAMADARLSGMEISDLAMELSDLGQEITQKVRNTTHVVHAAEEKLRQFATLCSTGTQPKAQTVDNANYPPLVKSVRGMKEGIVKSRSFLQMFISFTYYVRLIRKFAAAKAQDSTR